MKMPPFLLAAAVLVWGWQSGYVGWVLPLAVALEASRWVRVRWDLSPADFHRLGGLCAAMFGVYALYLTLATDGGLGLGAWVTRGETPTLTNSRSVELFRRLVRGLPWCLAPIVLAQVWSRSPRLNVSTLSWILRRHLASSNVTVDTRWPFLVITVLGASAGDHPPGLLAVLISIVGWAVWVHRGRTFAPLTWAAAFALAVGISWLGHAGLKPVAAWWSNLESDFINRMLNRDGNANETHTSIGSVGIRKNSGGIVFRLQKQGPGGTPNWLGEAAFDTYRGSTWLNTSGTAFTEVAAARDEGSFVFTPKLEPESAFRLWLPPSARCLVPVPVSLRRLEAMPVDSLETNGLGVVRVNGLRFGGFPVVSGRTSAVAPVPGVADRGIPDAEAAVLGEVASEIGLTRDLPVSERMRRIAEFFAGHFTYALYRGPAAVRPRTSSTLESFLRKDRRGHCEYFATATTLLLRHAGIPARYVVGWAVPETEPGGEWTLVRARHAHAWTIAYIDGTWREVDNTPASWESSEDENASVWNRFWDAGSQLVFGWNRFRYGRAGWRQWVLFPAGLLLIGLLVQIFRRRGWRRFDERAAGNGAWVRPGLDSEFYAVLRAVEKCGFERRPGETLQAWLERVRGLDPTLAASLGPLLGLHYRLRFDPVSLAPVERRGLHQEARDWLQRWRR